MVLLDHSPDGGWPKCPDSTLDGAVPLWLFPNSLLESLVKIKEDQREEVVLFAIELVEEFMVSSTSPDGMRDRSLAPLQDGSPVTPAHEGHTLQNLVEDPQIDFVEVDWQAL